MIFIYPTDTSYGIGCDARNATAVKKIFKIKRRASGKTVPLIAASAQTAAQYIDARAWRRKEIQRAIKKFWPGAFTLVAPASAFARRVLARGVIAKDGTIAIRVPDNKIARAISKSIGAPVVATSANRSGEQACYTAAAVRRAFARSRVHLDVFFDAGTLSRRPASTIAQFQNGKWEVLRQGPTLLSRAAHIVRQCHTIRT